MRFFDTGTRGLKEALVGLANEVDDLQDRQERIQESLQSRAGLAALVQEDEGWRLIGGGESTYDEVDLDYLKTHAHEARRLRALNPLVKRGVVVRNAYIWQHDIKFPDAAKRILENPTNQEQVFGEAAKEELEASLATDGQYFILCDGTRKETHRIPFSEITGTVRNPEFNDEVWYYRRTYTKTSTNLRTGVASIQPEEVNIWYPAIGYTGEVAKKINDQKVDGTKRIEHAVVNSFTGFPFGIPDLIGAVYWAGAYKQYLEASYTLAKALARLAFKVSNQSSRGSKAVAAKLAGPVNRNEAGSTVTLGAGQDLQAINKSGSGIDFGAGTPLASMVAASLDVPLSVLLTDGSAGGRQGAEAALEDPTIRTMNMRRKTHKNSLARILRYFGVEGELVWPPLNGDHIHRRLQSLQLAVDSGLIHREEGRADALRTLEIDTDKAINDLPEIERNVPQTDGPGPLSDGTNDSRDNPGGPTDA